MSNLLLRLLVTVLLVSMSQSFHVSSQTTRRWVSSRQMSAAENEDGIIAPSVPMSRPVKSSDSETVKEGGIIAPSVPLKRPETVGGTEDGIIAPSVPMKRSSTVKEDGGIIAPSVPLSPVTDTVGDESIAPQNQRKRSLITAIVAILLAIGNYVYQYTHPITAVQLLAEMEQSSAPMSTIGTNGKPTVVDFWAPWCENCKLSAPTLKKVEEMYGDRVNFVLVNGDQPQAWDYIEAFGVDAIPHLAMVSAEGNVETALIGPIPKSVLEADLDVLIENAQQGQEKKPLPYQMLDVFANRPEKRHVHFDP